MIYKPIETHPSNIARPGSPAAKDATVDELSGVTQNNQTRKKKSTSWRQMFCLRFGVAVAATGVAVARMLVNRHGARERC